MRWSGKLDRFDVMMIIAMLVLLVTKIVVLNGGMGAVHLVLVDLSTTPYTLHNLVPDTVVISEAEATWRADSKALIVARQPPERKITEGSTLYNTSDVESPLTS
ncbi:MAG: hypothetical protein ABI947_20340 [Chloroflexota bacterium]